MISFNKNKLCKPITFNKERLDAFNIAEDLTSSSFSEIIKNSGLRKLNFFICGILCFLLSLALSGCNSDSEIKKDKRSKTESLVYLSKNGSFKLLCPDGLEKSLGKNLSLNQEMRASFKDTEQRFNLILENTSQETKVIGLTNLGNRLFMVTYDCNQVKVELSPLLKMAPNIKKLKPEYILADIQLVYWPLEEIQRNLSDNLKIKEISKDNQTKRILFEGEKPIIEIVFSAQDILKSKIYYHHLERGYSYSIENLN